MPYDIIIIGAGHNALTAGIYLSQAGLKTLILERNAQPGGAVRSAEITRPGCIHDLYSANQNLFLTSQVYQDYQSELEGYGLEYCVSDKPFVNVFPDNKNLKVYQGAEKTLHELSAHNQHDANGWKTLHGEFKKFEKHLLPLLSVPMPSWKAGGLLAKTAATLGFTPTLELADIILSSTRELGDRYLDSPEAKALLACWGMHIDFGPNVSGGAMFPFTEAFTNLQNGMSLPKGGASRMIDALVQLYRRLGGELQTDAAVEEVIVKQGKVRGVRLKNQTTYTANTVLASTTPTALFTQLIASSEVPAAFLRRAKTFEYGPATMMVHVLLNGKAPWAADEALGDFAYVHIGPYVEQMDQTYTQAMNGYLPESPMLIVGQPTAVDPSRTPNDEQILWIQVRTLPRTIKGDAAQQLSGTDWDEIKEAYADRVMDKLERYAPGLKEQVLERVVHSPRDLERSNPNLNGGDSVSGSHHLNQNFLFRPFNGYSNYRMPIKGLYLTGASTWPGAGTNATSGYLAARQILSDRSYVPKIAGAVAATAGAALVGKLISDMRHQ